MASYRVSVRLIVDADEHEDAVRQAVGILDSNAHLMAYRVELVDPYNYNVSDGVVQSWFVDAEKVL